MAQEPGLALGRARGPHLDLPGELSLTLHTHSLTPTHSSLPGISISGPLHMAVLPCGASYPRPRGLCMPAVSSTTAPVR